MRFFIFSILTMIGVSVAQAQTCADIFSARLTPALRSNGIYDLNFVHIKNMQRAQGTKVQIATEFLNERNLEGLYVAAKSWLVLRDDQSALDQFFYFHHEAVHSTTWHRLRTQPRHPENSLAIQVTRLEASIHPDLPTVYQENFYADEMKSYLRGSILASQIVAQTDLSKADQIRFQDRTGESRAASKNFAKVTDELLAEAEILLSTPKQHIQLHVEPFGEVFPDVFRVTLTLPRKTAPPVEMHFPVYDPQAKDNHIHKLRATLVRLCQEGRRISQQYR